MIRHIFCDLDGTLYNKGINEEDVKAIRNIENEGVIFHVATGRVFKQAYKMINEKFKLNGYFICENGSFIFDKDKNLIFKEPLDDYLVRKIINTLEQDEFYVRATRIEIPASITATEFYRKFGYDYKNGVKELDEEHHYRLEKFKEAGQ